MKRRKISGYWEGERWVELSPMVSEALNRIKAPKTKHGGKREGAGRKSALKALRTKKLRATDAEWEEFLSYLTGDAIKDFETIIHALVFWRKIVDLPIKEKGIDILDTQRAIPHCQTAPCSERFHPILHQPDS